MLCLLCGPSLVAEALELDHRDWIHDHQRTAERTAEQAFDQLNASFGVPADRTDDIGHGDTAQRERALSLGVRVAVHDSRQNEVMDAMDHRDRGHRRRSFRAASWLMSKGGPHA